MVRLAANFIIPDFNSFINDFRIVVDPPDWISGSEDQLPLLTRSVSPIRESHELESP